MVVIARNALLLQRAEGCAVIPVRSIVVEQNDRPGFSCAGRPRVFDIPMPRMIETGMPLIGLCPGGDASNNVPMPSAAAKLHVATKAAAARPGAISIALAVHSGFSFFESSDEWSDAENSRHCTGQRRIRGWYRDRAVLIVRFIVDLCCRLWKLPSEGGPMCRRDDENHSGCEPIGKRLLFFLPHTTTLPDHISIGYSEKCHFFYNHPERGAYSAAKARAAAASAV